MGVIARQYDGEDAYYAAIVDDLESAPEALKELRRATNALILVHSRREGQQVVKVVAGDMPVRKKIKGYVTFLEFLQKSSLQELEQKLGFNTGVLQQHGAHMYHVDALALDVDFVAPRGHTGWSGGVTPRDLYEISQAIGRDVGYHRDYPSACRQIFQFEILKDVAIIGAPRFIDPKGIV